MDKLGPMTVSTLKRFLADLPELEGLSDDALVCFHPRHGHVESAFGITLEDVVFEKDGTNGQMFILLGGSEMAKVIENNEAEVLERPTRQ